MWFKPQGAALKKEIKGVLERFYPDEFPRSRSWWLWMRSHKQQQNFVDPPAAEGTILPQVDIPWADASLEAPQDRSSGQANGNRESYGTPPRGEYIPQIPVRGSSLSRVYDQSMEPTPVHPYSSPPTQVTSQPPAPTFYFAPPTPPQHSPRTSAQHGATNSRQRQSQSYILHRSGSSPNDFRIVSPEGGTGRMSRLLEASRTSGEGPVPSTLEGHPILLGDNDLWEPRRHTGDMGMEGDSSRFRLRGG